MKTSTTVLKIGLGALALWTGAAATMAAPTITSFIMTPPPSGGAAAPRLTIQSDMVVTNSIDYKTTLSQTTWTPLTNLLVVQSPYSVADPSARSAASRYYRVGVSPGPAPLATTVLIPAGSFAMGDTFNEGDDDERPVHTNYVSSFYMDTNLVSQALWDQVHQWAASNGYSFDDTESANDTDYPIVNVTWADAVKWCNARSEMEQLTPSYYTDSTLTNVYRANGDGVDPDNLSVKWDAGYRLPTEAEWEKAARGGAFGHRYPWTDSDTITYSRAHYQNDPQFYNTPSPVGFYPPNGYHLYDMAGNLWEWCWDWYDGSWYSDPDSGSDDTPGPSSSTGYRVLRGGSFSNPGFNTTTYDARCACRNYDDPTAAFFAYGFRCARGQ